MGSCRARSVYLTTRLLGRLPDQMLLCLSQYLGSQMYRLIWWALAVHIWPILTAPDMKRIFRIRPNYHTVRLGFSKILGKCSKICSYLYLGYTLKEKRSALDSSNDAYAIFLCCFSFVIFFITAYVVGTHLNCIDKSMQFKWAPTTFAFKKYTGCNLKTLELLDCALIGVCVEIRSNTVDESYSCFSKRT